MLWLYHIKSCFILICEPHAFIEPIIKELSPSLLPTERAGEGACYVTARDKNSEFIKNILYVFE